MACGRVGGVEERQVGRVGDDALVEQQRVGEAAARRGSRPAAAAAASSGVNGSPGTRRGAISIGRSRVSQRRSSGGSESLSTVAIRSGSVGSALGVGRARASAIWCPGPPRRLERRRQVEDRVAVLDGDDAARGEACGRRGCGPPGRGSASTDRPGGGSTRAASARVRCSTVRPAATSAWPATWPPNTRWRFSCGLRPRKRFTLELLEVEDPDQAVDGVRHGGPCGMAGVRVRPAPCAAAAGARQAFHARCRHAELADRRRHPAGSGARGSGEVLVRDARLRHLRLRSARARARREDGRGDAGRRHALRTSTRRATS